MRFGSEIISDGCLPAQEIPTHCNLQDRVTSADQIRRPCYHSPIRAVDGVLAAICTDAIDCLLCGLPLSTVLTDDAPHIHLTCLSGWGFLHLPLSWLGHAFRQRAQLAHIEALHNALHCNTQLKLWGTLERQNTHYGLQPNRQITSQQKKLPHRSDWTFRT